MPLARSRFFRSHQYGLALVVLPLACADEPEVRACTDPHLAQTARPDVPLVWQTEHLDIHADEGVRVCAGMAAEYERHVELVADQLGIEARTHIPLFLLTSRPDACDGNPACTTPDGVVFSHARASYHELAHGVACQLRTDSIPALSEGLAVMFGPESLSPRHPELEISSLLKEPYPLASQYYRDAGHFSRWLLEQQGGDSFADVYAVVEREEGLVSIAMVEEAISSIYGVSLADLEAEYLEAAPYAWAPLYQCEDLPVIDPQPDGDLLWSSFLDCDDESTLGPYECKDPFVADPAQLMYQSFTFLVPAAGNYVVEFEGAKQIEFERCAERHAVDEADADIVFDWAVALYATSDVALTPGLWRADVLNYNSLPGPVEVRIQPP